jgi:hypothetical protein
VSLGNTNGKEASLERALRSSATALAGVEATLLPHLGQLFVRRDIDVRLGDTNGKEASLERALDFVGDRFSGRRKRAPSGQLGTNKQRSV